jgi:hypothetical protein
MPNKHNADRRHHFGKMKFKVRNWASYEAGLRRRGSLTLWVAKPPPLALFGGRSSRISRSELGHGNERGLRAAWVFRSARHRLRQTTLPCGTAMIIAVAFAFLTLFVLLIMARTRRESSLSPQKPEADISSGTSPSGA